MDEQFIVPDLQIFHSLSDENAESLIKTEDDPDDVDILFFNQLEQLSNDSNLNSSDGFQIVQEVELLSNPSDPNFGINGKIDVNEKNCPANTSNGDDIGCELIDDENDHKLPIDLTGFDLKSESTSSSHFIKYKLQDGKHIKIWECGICGKEFSHQYTLMRHLPTHTDERKFQCKSCGKAFRQMSTLSQHRAIHSSQRPYICEICRKTFNRVSTLISHRKTHTGLKPHRCHLCDKAFHQKGNLRNHIFTHTNERPYKCDVCKKGFNQMSNLMCHKIKTHHRTDRPKYVCQICGKAFPKRIALRNHEQLQHGMSNSMEVPIDKAPYPNAIIVDPIKTEAMKLAMESNQTPFALLRPLSGIPVLVRVLSAGDKQMLVPATAEDLKKHGQISITPKVSISEENKENQGETKAAVGSTVQIKIPVVATVIQQCGQGGQMCMSVVSPGPDAEVLNGPGNNSLIESYIFSSSLTQPSTSVVKPANSMPILTDLPANGDNGGFN